MKKLICITLLLLTIIPCLRAQRKELSQARSYIKSGKDLDKAEKLMTDLLAKDSDNRANVKIYLTLYQAVQKQYDAGNEKLYLKQKYDTAALFNNARRMFDILESLDSVDATPDDKGRVSPKYRQKHASLLNVYRPNLYYGGTYFIRKGDFKKAFVYFDTYINTSVQPLFSSYNYGETDNRMSEVAYWTVYCGYKSNDADMMLKHAQLALNDTSKRRFTLQYMAEAYKLKKAEDSYLATLKDGFEQYPTFMYFFPRLTDYYIDKKLPEMALNIADKALETDNKNILFLFAKSTVLLNMGRNDECIAVSDSIIHQNDSIAEPYFNAGTAYLNKAFEYEEKNKPRQYRSEIKKNYQDAMPYIEKYRKLAPNESKKWAPALYRIYFNLNMGKQFEEIDKILKK